MVSVHGGFAPDAVSLLGLAPVRSEASPPGFHRLSILLPLARSSLCFIPTVVWLEDCNIGTISC